MFLLNQPDFFSFYRIAIRVFQSILFAVTLWHSWSHILEQLTGYFASSKMALKTIILAMLLFGIYFSFAV